MEHSMSPLEKYRNSGLPYSIAEKLANDLEFYMSNEKLFRKNDLSLQTVAQKLNTRLHYASQVINQFYQTNFFEYLNRKRIDEAKQLLKSPKDEYRIIEVAYAVGYNNKNTFNTAFKRLTGQTPSEYRLQITSKQASGVSKGPIL